MTTEAETTTGHDEFDHHIEERAVVWLRLSADGKAWEIDSPSDDGYPLEGYDNGALHEECPACDGRCEDGDPLADEIAKQGDALARDYTRLPDLPTLRELHRIIGEHLREA